MLKIFNDLSIFFEDCYSKLTVREYSKIRKVSPPTASSWLKMYEKEGLLLSMKERNMNLFFANRENPIFVRLSQLYWFIRFLKIGLIEYLKKEYLNPTIVLFGSLSKAETLKNSDVDLAVFSSLDHQTNLSSFENILKREIHVFVFKSLKDIKNRHLRNNIQNGYLLCGKW